MPGSETISFTNYTSASLGGCVTIGILEVKHGGKIDDAIILLKNEAFRFNSDLLIVIKMSSASNTITETISQSKRACLLARSNLREGTRIMGEIIDLKNFVPIRRRHASNMSGIRD